MNFFKLTAVALISLSLAPTLLATSCTQTKFDTCKDCTPGSIKGVVYFDGVARQGVVVQLSTGSQGPVATSTTSSTGEYVFPAPSIISQCGNYIVSIASLGADPDYTQVAPSSYASFVENSGPGVTQIDFKFKKGSCTAGREKKVVFNSGYDRDANTPLNVDWSATTVGPLDEFWTLTQEAEKTSAGFCDTLKGPTQARTRKPNTAWDNFPNAEWISAYRDQSVNGFHAYTHCFCLHKNFDAKEAVFNPYVLADDHVAILLNGQVLWDSYKCPADMQDSLGYGSLGSVYKAGGSNAPASYPPGTDASSYNTEMFRKLLRAGTNCLTFQVRNTHGVDSGLTIRGGLKIPSGQCCIDTKPQPNACRAIKTISGAFRGCAGVCNDRQVVEAVVGIDKTKVVLPTFGEMDTDGNKIITKEEAAAATTAFDQKIFAIDRSATERKRKSVQARERRADQMIPTGCSTCGRMRAHRQLPRYGTTSTTMSTTTTSSTSTVGAQAAEVQVQLRSVFEEFDANDDGFIEMEEFHVNQVTLSVDGTRSPVVAPTTNKFASPDDPDCVPMNNFGEPMDSFLFPSGVTANLWEREFSGRCGCEAEPPKDDDCCTPQFTYGQLGWVFDKCSGDCEEKGESCKPMNENNEVMDMNRYNSSDPESVRIFTKLFKQCQCTKRDPPTGPCPTAYTDKDVPYCPGNCPLAEPEPIKRDVCGTIQGLQCGMGYTCVDDPTDNCDPLNGGSDCAGFCHRICGGLAGFRCPTNEKCIDDPRDDCAPPFAADCPGYCIDDIPVVTNKCQPLSQTGQVLIPSSMSVDQYKASFNRCGCPPEQCQYTLQDIAFTNAVYQVKMCTSRCLPANAEPNVDYRCIPVDNKGNSIAHLVAPDTRTEDSVHQYVDFFEKCTCPEPVDPEPCQPIYISVDATGIRVPVCRGACTDDEGHENKCIAVDKDDNELNIEAVGRDVYLKYFKKCGCPACRPVRQVQDALDTSVSLCSKCSNGCRAVQPVWAPKIGTFTCSCRELN